MFSPRPLMPRILSSVSGAAPDDAVHRVAGNDGNSTSGERPRKAINEPGSAARATMDVRRPCAFLREERAAITANAARRPEMPIPVALNIDVPRRGALSKLEQRAHFV